MNYSLLGSGETFCSAFYIHPPTLIFTETRWRRGVGWVSAFYKKKTCDGSGGLASPRPTSTPRSQILGAFVQAPPPPPAPRPGLSALPGGSEPQEPSGTASQALPDPPQEPPARPALAQRPPGVPPARSARRSPRGDHERAALTSPGAGCGLCSLAPGPPTRTLRPSPRRLIRRLLDTATFIFLNTLGRKAKAKVEAAERRA